MVSKGLDDVWALYFYAILNSPCKQLKIIMESSSFTKSLLREEQASKSEMDLSIGSAPGNSPRCIHLMAPTLQNSC